MRNHVRGVIVREKVLGREKVLRAGQVKVTEILSTVDANGP